MRLRLPSPVNVLTAPLNNVRGNVFLSCRLAFLEPACASFTFNVVITVDFFTLRRQPTIFCDDYQHVDDAINSQTPTNAGLFLK